LSITLILSTIAGIPVTQNARAAATNRSTDGLPSNFLPLLNYNTINAPQNVVTKSDTDNNGMTDTAKSIKPKPCSGKGSTFFEKPVLSPYAVQGKTLKQAYDNTKVPGHPEFAGLTTPKFKVDYVLNSKNKIQCANILVTFTIQYPQWIEECNQCKNIRKEWDAFVERVLEHENGHVSYLKDDLGEIYKKFFNEQLTGDEKQDTSIIRQMIIDKVSPIVEKSDKRFHKDFGETIKGPDLSTRCGSQLTPKTLSADTSSGTSIEACIAGSPRIYVVHSLSDGFITVIDTDANQVNSTIPVGNSPNRLAFDFIDQKLYVTHALQAGVVSVVNASNNKLIKDMPVGYEPGKILFDSTHKKLYVLDGHGKISIIDANTDTVKGTIQQGFINNMILDVDKNRLYFHSESGSGDTHFVTLFVISTDTDELIGSLPIVIDPLPIKENVEFLSLDSPNDKLYIRHRIIDAGLVSEFISVIDAKIMKETNTIHVVEGGIHGGIEGMIVDSAHAKLYVSVVSEAFVHSILVISTLSDEVIDTVTLPSDATRFGDQIIFVDSNHNKLYLESQPSVLYVPRTILIINTTTDELISSINLSLLGGLAYDSIHEKLYLSEEFNDVVSILDSKTNVLDGKISVGFRPENTIFGIVQN